MEAFFLGLVFPARLSPSSFYGFAPVSRYLAMCCTVYRFILGASISRSQGHWVAARPRKRKEGGWESKGRRILEEVGAHFLAMEMDICAGIS